MRFTLGTSDFHSFFNLERSEISFVKVASKVAFVIRKNRSILSDGNRTGKDFCISLRQISEITNGHFSAF